LKLNGTHQRLVYADDVTISGGSVHTVKKNTESLLVASKENSIEANAGKAEYMVMFRDQNDNININNSSFERVEEFKYLGTTLRNQNSVQDEITNRRQSGNACCHSVQNSLSSSLLSKNI